MFSAFPEDNGDALIYGGIAKNIVLHGKFAISDGSGVVHSTLIRLPGYPLFLSACFRIFGVARYNAVSYLQIFLELAACLLLADFVRRISTSRAGLNALWLAAMCPFTAVYASAPLTESLTFDMICLALWSLERYLSQLKKGKAESGRAAWSALLLFTLAISCAALLRPDGALLAFALWPALFFSTRQPGVPFRRAAQRALLCALISVLPFAIWTARNWRTFHAFEPLAPRYANDPGEDPHYGWQHWVKTWCLDFTCTSEIYWNVPDNTIDLSDLPGWAFDSQAQREQTSELFAEYNRDQEISPELDARFEALAKERAADHPLRNWVLLPVGRLADMTLRPRVENLPIDMRWWQYWAHRSETRFSVVYGLVNLILILLGIFGLLLRPRYWPYMLAYLVLRSLLLLTIEAPETRYTLEFFPVLFATGGIALQRIFSRQTKPGAAAEHA
jgi:dolichyl-phosphate-mannose-protein mannosyltransferase